MNSIIPNDIKKGDVGYQKNGWKFEMMDNKKGNTRLAKVYGIYTEIGSIYATDIDFIIRDGEDIKVDSSQYNKQKSLIDSLW
jgi:hypothetical protein|tara:strand:+ start:1859 stop:2104 length:246 start_codon:yes stop_codon:yes gene_type:complete